MFNRKNTNFTCQFSCSLTNSVLRNLGVLFWVNFFVRISMDLNEICGTPKKNFNFFRAEICLEHCTLPNTQMNIQYELSFAHICYDDDENTWVWHFGVVVHSISENHGEKKNSRSIDGARARSMKNNFFSVEKNRLINFQKKKNKKTPKKFDAKSRTNKKMNLIWVFPPSDNWDFQLNNFKRMNFSFASSLSCIGQSPRCFYLCVCVCVCLRSVCFRFA